jgi:hypothetical protein
MLAKKHALKIARLFNSLVVAESMIRTLIERRNQGAISHEDYVADIDVWKSAIRRNCAELEKEYGIVPVGYKVWLD